MPGTALGTEHRSAGQNSQPHTAAVLEEAADGGNTREARERWLGESMKTAGTGGAREPC